MITQIYEVSSPAEARAVAQLGIDHVGFKVGSGEFPRELSIPDAAAIIAAVPRPARCSVLFLAADPRRISAWARALEPSIVHLGAAPEALSAQDVAWLVQQLPGRLIMRSLPVSGEHSLALARSYDGVADVVMLDSASSNNKIGALGVTHDWELSRRIVETLRIPVYLAGGLGPDNVAEAIRRVRPAGVDSKTKTDRVDQPHRKDLELVRRFHAAASAAD